MPELKPDNFDYDKNSPERKKPNSPVSPKEEHIELEQLNI